MKKNIQTKIKPSSANPPSLKATAGRRATASKEETDTEMLARIMVNGFEDIMKTIATLATKEELASVKKDVSSIKEKLSVVEDDITSIRGELSSIKEEQKETNRRLSSIERKQTGIVEP